MRQSSSRGQGEAGPDTRSPSQWAERVQRQDPHGLDELDARVLAYAAKADELAKTPWWRIAWGLSPYLALLGSIGGFAALFGNPRDIRIGRTDEPDAYDIPFAAISYAAALVGVICILIFWIRAGHRRNTALQICLGLAFGFGAAGVPIAYGLAAEDDVEVGLQMLPAYVMMAIALILIVVIQLSPPMDPVPELPPVPIDQLGTKAMKHLMQERDSAIDKLAERRMLPDVDVKALKARPLGRLHISDDEAG